jgi:nucleoside phosphorylase
MMSARSVLSLPCLVFALSRESMHFRRAYPVQQRFVGAPCLAQFRGPRRADDPCSAASMLMLETGIGAAAMETALRWCLSGPRFGDAPYRPSFLLSVGFSGALQPEQKVGDLVLASEIVDEQGYRWEAMIPDTLAGEEIALGRLLSVTRLVSDPQEKRRLGQQQEALAVDMESAAAARLCHQHSIPFACLRVISDDWQTPLSPQLVQLLRNGRVSLASLTRRVLRHPMLIGELWRLAGQTRRASLSLLSPLSALIRDDLWMGASG